MRTRKIESVMQFDNRVTVYYEEYAPVSYKIVNDTFKAPRDVILFIRKAKYRFEYKYGPQYDGHESIIEWANSMPLYGFMAKELLSKDMRIVEQRGP